MDDKEALEIAKSREYKVSKSNDIIQRARFDLSLMEQKMIAYIVSKIKPTDKVLQEYVFDIREFCKICGIDWNNGGNYDYIKTILKKLRDRSVWITLDDGSETTVSWVNKVTTNKRSGSVKIRLDDDMHPYLIDLTDRFTCYELYNTLPMKSQYSIRIYELLKSYEYIGKKIFEIDDLKKKLFAEHYVNFKEFRVKVIEIALKEINEYTDIKVDYETICKGRKVIKVQFLINAKDVKDRLASQNRTMRVLEGQA